MKLTPVSDNIRVFIGYDENEVSAYHVLTHSIIRNSTNPVSITPVKRSQLHWSFNRERDPKQSTDFTYTRFLIPWMCNYQGYAIFMDCDMLCRSDISELWNLRSHHYAVQVVKHDYTPSVTTKFLGQEQTIYPRKNWSSVMILNNSRCTALTPGYIAKASGAELHQFKWLDDAVIGGLPKEWNHLVDEYPHDDNAKLIHYTNGGPYFNDYSSCDYAKEWMQEYDMHNYCKQVTK